MTILKKWTLIIYYGTWLYQDSMSPQNIKQPKDYDQFDNFINRFIPLASCRQKRFGVGVCQTRFQMIFHNKGYELFGIDYPTSVKALEIYMKKNKKINI